MKKENAKWRALLILLTAPLLSVIDVFIINVAIPSIKKGVHATDAEVQLVIAGYLLGYAAFLITGGRAGDHFGRKKTFFRGMFFFTLISCLCGLSQTPAQLNSTRFFQGVSASFMVPQSIAYIQVLFTDAKERSRAIGWFGITLGIASIIGQVLGGYLSDFHGMIDGWRLIFFINLPIGIVALWMTHRYLEETPRHDGKVFDYSGVVILTAALVCLIYPLIQGREKGWPLWSMGMLILSVGIFFYFARHQKRKLAAGGQPLIDIHLFGIRDFNIGLLAVLFHFMMHTSFLLISAVYLQNGLGLSAAECGLYFIAPGTLFTFSSIAASRLLPLYGKRVLQAGVLLLVIVFIFQIQFFRPPANGLFIFLLMGLYGLGNGLVLPSLLNIALKNVPTRYAGAAAGIYSTFQQTASALGISIIGGLFYFIVSLDHRNPDYGRAFDYGIIAEIGCLVFVGFMLYLLPEGGKRVHGDQGNAPPHAVFE